MTDQKKILLIGGTSEAVQINERISDLNHILLITSLAGRTNKPTPLNGEVLPNGFSEVRGMEALVKNRDISLVIDASHPFAVTISEKSERVCAEQGIEYWRFNRPEWEEQSGDNWSVEGSLETAVLELEPYKRIFLTIGRQELGAFEKLKNKDLLIRSIEPADFNPSDSSTTEIRSRGPFSVQDEMNLLREHQIEVLVSKNSGGDLTYAKIEAARNLSIPVIMIERPRNISAQSFSQIDALIRQLQLSV
ncbi:hypothetical protein A9Q83_06980 [Alphaproteobacteria bacterium 46_93_T64]|nr:hypothetical protein A9Q83_06980 [Alphaproteobacteria bacterium 46_93_T64]